MVAGFVFVRRSPAELLLDTLGVVPTIDVAEQGVLGVIPCPPTVPIHPPANRKPCWPRNSVSAVTPSTPTSEPRARRPRHPLRGKRSRLPLSRSWPMTFFSHSSGATGSEPEPLSRHSLAALHRLRGLHRPETGIRTRGRRGARRTTHWLGTPRRSRRGLPVRPAISHRGGTGRCRPPDRTDDCRE